MCKLVLQKKITKNETKNKFLNLIKREKSRPNSNVIFSKDCTFYKYRVKGYIKEFQDILELFYDDTEEIKPNNEEQKGDLEKIKVAIITASKLFMIVSR